MNTMTNAMTWDAIAANEGSEIEAISDAEVGIVSGGGWISVVITAQSARRTCGRGNVKSVTSDGFTRKQSKKSIFRELTSQEIGDVAGGWSWLGRVVKAVSTA